MSSSTAPRVAVIGAGSFVFSLALLHDLIMDHRLDGLSLALMDIDQSVAETMAGIAQRMAADAGITVHTEATTNRDSALQGADFVTCSAAIQIARRWTMDRETIARYGLIEPVSECGGVGGLSYALRHVPFMLGLARDMERLCPRAWLLNATNPLPRLITTVTRYTGIRALGFCNASVGPNGFDGIAELLGRVPRDITAVSAGLNHFAWLLAVRDRWTGEDLLPAVEAALAAGRFGDRLSTKLWRQYGSLPLASGTHVNEYLPFDPADADGEESGFHGDAEERARHRREMVEAAQGQRPWQTLLRHGRAWERPADVIHALVTGTRRHMDAVNLPNRGAIAGLPDDAVVEVPVEVADGAVRGMPIGALPAPVAALCAQVSAVHTLVAEAAATGDRALIAQVIETDPAMPNKPAAHAALAELMQLHADVLPQFA